MTLFALIICGIQFFCFLDSGLLPIALSFFIGCEYYNEDDEDAANVSASLKKLTKDSKVMQVAKRRGKRQRQFERQVIQIKKKGREREAATEEYNPLDAQAPVNLVYDPQNFAERLFRCECAFFFYSTFLL